MARYAAKHSKSYDLQISIAKPAAFSSRVFRFRPVGADCGNRMDSDVFLHRRVVFHEKGGLKTGAYGAGRFGRRCFVCLGGFFQGRQKSMNGTPFPHNSPFSLPANMCKLASSTQSNPQEMVSGISDSKQDMTESLKLSISRESEEMNSSKEVCSMYIKKLCCLGRVSDAVSLLFRLHDRQIELDLDIYHTLLAATVEINNFELFCGVFQKLLLSKRAPDTTAYGIVAKALLNLSCSNLLIGFIREVSKITSHGDPAIKNRIIFSTAKSGQIDKSMTMFQELKNLNRVDVITFNTVLAFLGKAGRVENMLSEFESMKKLGYAPDIVTYNTLINCFRRLGRLDLCKACANEALERGFQLDLQAYTALIDVFGRAGHVDHAMALFIEMKKSRRPSIYVYRALIGNLKKYGKIETALDLLEEMNSDSSELIGPEDIRYKTDDHCKGWTGVFLKASY